jgi:hypothetical protein
MTAASEETYEFDVAVSFAGEDREYVEEVVAPLKQAKVRVFYDSDYMADTWGENLVEFFDGVYRKRSRYAVIFVSRHYAAKMWPRLERRSALARAMEQRAAYVLPIRLDDAEIDGLLPTVGMIDARRHGIEKIVEAILRKLAGGPAATPGAIARVPRTEAEQQLLLLEKPGGWEYLYFASELLRERDALEAKYRDHEMRWAAPTGVAVRREDLADYLQAALGAASRLAGSLGQVMDAKVQEKAFGAPGESGDAERILHMAKRWTSIYEGFMDWSANIRGTVVPSGYGDVVEALAQYSDASIENYRQFVDKFVEQVDRVPAAVESGEPLMVEMDLVLEISEDVKAAYDDAVQRALREEG